jgi:hypothetical protein
VAFPLSPQSIEALAEVISGGSGNGNTQPIGIYRSATKLGSFMRNCNVDFQLIGSRVPSLTDRLLEINRGKEPEKVLPRIIEAAADPRDFIHEGERLQAVIDYLNGPLQFDGLELQHAGKIVRLVAAGGGSPVVQTLADVADTISFDTVQRDLARALASAQDDPEDAVTAACSTIESVCRSILIELGEPLPAKKDIKGLYNAVKRPLGLSPDRTDFNTEIAEDVRTILSGLSTIVGGIGSLRTHGGDAHGRERGFVRIDPRIARLAIHASSTLTLFLIETWQRKFPAKALPRHAG